MLNRLLGLPESASEHGIQLDWMLEFVHWFMLLLFVGWTIFFIFVLIRFSHRRNPQANYYGARTKATTHVEVSVVVIEVVLLMGFAFPIWAKRVNSFPVEEAVRVRVIGQQFVWNFHYPGEDGVFGRQDVSLISANNSIGLDRADPAARDDITTLNDLRLPVNRPAILELHSKDVIHNLAITHMRAQHDAIPGTMVPMWFTPTATGSYEMVCAQLCGLGHYNMRAMLTVETAEDYAQWLKSSAAMIPKEEPPQPAQPQQTHSAPPTQMQHTTPVEQQTEPQAQPEPEPKEPPASQPPPDDLHGG